MTAVYVLLSKEICSRRSFNYSSVYHLESLFYEIGARGADAGTDGRAITAAHGHLQYQRNHRNTPTNIATHCRNK